MKKTINIFLLLVLGINVLSAAKSKIKFSASSMQGSIKEGQNSTSLTGNAVVMVDTMEIKADRIEIYGKDYRYLKATGTVTGEDKEKGFSFSSNFMQYDRDKEIATFFGKTELNDTKNDVKITSEHIEYNQKAETMLMQFDVKILRKEITCTSMFAIYNRKSSALNLTGRPIVTKSKDTFQAAKIAVNLDTEDITLEGRVSGNVVEEKRSQQEQTPKNDNNESLKKSPENNKSVENSNSEISPKN
ncbi:MAG: LptA/OstA family protein [Treponema sp.]